MERPNTKELFKGATNKVAIAMGSGALALTGCGAEAEPAPTITETVMVETTVTETPEPAPTVTVTETVEIKPPEPESTRLFPEIDKNTIENAGLEIVETDARYDYVELKCTKDGYTTYDLPLGGSVSINGTELATEWISTEDDGSKAGLLVSWEEGLDISGGAVLAEGGQAFIIDDQTLANRTFTLLGKDFKDGINSSRGIQFCAKTVES